MKLLKKLIGEEISDVRTAWIERVRIEHQNLSKSIAAMPERGYEEVSCSGPVTEDGRPVYEIYGRRWAQRQEIHAARLASAFAAARQSRPEPETKSVVGTESLSAMVCPKCGDALQHTAVCPSCAAGKLGYRHRYTCVCGGVDLISREAL